MGRRDWGTLFLKGPVAMLNTPTRATRVLGGGNLWGGQKDTCPGHCLTLAPLSCREWVPGRQGAAEPGPGAPAGAEEGGAGRWSSKEENTDVSHSHQEPAEPRFLGRVNSID